MLRYDSFLYFSTKYWFLNKVSFFSRLYKRSRLCYSVASVVVCLSVRNGVLWVNGAS